MLAEFKTRSGWIHNRTIDKSHNWYTFAVTGPLNFTEISSEFAYDEVKVEKIYFKLADYWTNSKGEIVKVFYKQV